MNSSSRKKLIVSCDYTQLFDLSKTSNTNAKQTLINKLISSIMSNIITKISELQIDYQNKIQEINFFEEH